MNSAVRLAIAASNKVTNFHYDRTLSSEFWTADGCSPSRFREWCTHFAGTGTQAAMLTAVCYVLRCCAHLPRGYPVTIPATKAMLPVTEMIAFDAVESA